MKKIALICPYFGKLPNYFPLVLQSMKSNNNIEWIVFTDDKTEYEYPANVNVKYMSFKELKILIKEKIPFIRDITPYKLCDFRPFYGIIFKSYLEKYDFWGFCDFDCIFGDLNKFITEDILNKYKKIFFLGHLSLFANIYEIEKILLNLLNTKECQMYLKLTTCSFQMDEIMVPALLKKNKIEIYQDSNNIIADICCTKKPFKICNEYLYYDKGNIIMKGNVIDNEGLVFSYINGKLIGYFLEEDTIYQKEYMYIHLQKRNMEFLNNINTDFLIIPNKFIPYRKVNKQLLKISAKSPFIYKKRWKISWNYKIDPIKRKIKILKYKIFNE